MSSFSRFMMLSLLLVIPLMVNAHSASAYTPRTGDYFNYSESITVNNGQGSYSGYTDQTSVTGGEQMNSVSGSTVSAQYSYTSNYSSNQGGSSSYTKSGNYTWSSNSFTYLSGTDNQTIYTPPIYVWFFIDASLPVGATLEALNTQLTVLSRNYSFPLSTSGTGYVQTIQAQGTGQYTRNDAYGVFTASYTWTEYFDPTTGFIVGYTYAEQDSSQSQGSFTYTDNLHVTSTSYALAAASPPATSTGLFGIDPFLILLLLIVILLIIFVIVILAVARSRRKRLPQHPYTPYTPPPQPQTPWESKIDLGSKPPEQVVLKEVAMVNCKYCRNLIPSTAERCPYCDGPNK